MDFVWSCSLTSLFCTCSGPRWVQIQESCWRSPWQFGQTGLGIAWSLGLRDQAILCSGTDEPDGWSSAAPPYTHTYIQIQNQIQNLDSNSDSESGLTLRLRIWTPTPYSTQTQTPTQIETQNETPTQDSDSESGFISTDNMYLSTFSLFFPRLFFCYIVIYISVCMFCLKLRKNKRDWFRLRWPTG